MTSFGDMMRVPGSNGAFFDATARGADIRMVYSPLDSLKIARQNPDKRVVFMAIGFETTAPSSAMTVLRAKAEGIENFSIFYNHVTIIPAIKAILDSPDLRLDGFIGPGHVSTVIGCRPYEFIAGDYGKPLVCAGFEPLDLLQSIYMLMLQLAEGRSEVENQYSRVVPWDGNLKALKVINEVMELRPYFEWRGLGFISPLGPAGAGGEPCLRRQSCSWSPGCGSPTPRPASAARSSRRAQAVGVQGVRHRLHPRDAHRHLHGVPRGRLRRLLQLRSLHPRARQGGDADVTQRSQRYQDLSREEQVLQRIEKARSRKAKLKEAHHLVARVGRQGGQTLIEAVFLEAFSNPLLAPWRMGPC